MTKTTIYIIRGKNIELKVYKTSLYIVLHKSETNDVFFGTLQKESGTEHDFAG